MNTTTIYESEIVTRSIARWGSAAAAIIFGLTFVTDRVLSWHVVSQQLIQIGLIVVMFAFYTLAWTKRFETLGSAFAILSMITAYVAYMVAFERVSNPPPSMWFLAVGIPALFHLIAIVLHRYGLYRLKS